MKIGQLIIDCNGDLRTDGDDHIIIGVLEWVTKSYKYHFMKSK